MGCRSAFRRPGLSLLLAASAAVLGSCITSSNTSGNGTSGGHVSPEGVLISPEGLTATYDTLAGTVTLKWHPVHYSKLDGYQIYRNDASSSDPVRINPGTLVRDTIFQDNLFDSLNSGDHDFKLVYRLKAQDKNANVSAEYSSAIAITAAHPGKVRTFFSFSEPRLTSDAGRLKDTVWVEVTYHNSGRPARSLEWFAGSKDSLVRTANPGALSLSGTDTIRAVFNTPGTAILYVRSVDRAGSAWWDSLKVRMSDVNTPPVLTGFANTSIARNKPFTFRIKAQDSDPIARYLWDFNGDGVNEDTTLDGSIVHTYAKAPESTSVIVTVEDKFGVKAQAKANLYIYEPFTGLAAVGAAGAVLLSTDDGLTWSKQSAANAGDFHSIGWNGKELMAVSYIKNSYGNYVFASPDGLSWVECSQKTPNPFWNSIWVGNSWLSGTLPGLYVSSDGRKWQERPMGDNGYSSRTLLDFAGTSTTQVGVGQGGLIIRSHNGLDWKQTYFPYVYSYDFRNRPDGNPHVWPDVFRYTLHSVAWTGTRFVAVGVDSLPSQKMILTSPDGEAWTRLDSGITQGGPLDDVVWSGSKLAAISSEGEVLLSDDGITWSSHPIKPGLKSIAWTGTRFVAVGKGGLILTSSDGVTWEERSSGTTSDLNSVATAWMQP